MNLPRKLAVTSPPDAIALTPYLLGFHPHDSLVILGHGGEGSFAFRLDLVGRERYSDLLMQLSGLLTRNDAEAAVLLGYGPQETAVPLLAEVRDALTDIVTVKDVVHVDGGRWWSLMCTDPQCCPAEGTPYDIATSRLAAQATFAGLVAYASREEMTAMVAPVDGEDRVWMAAETERAEQELLDITRSPSLLVQQGVQLVRSLIGQDRGLTDHEVARLSIVLTSLRVRDEALALIPTLDPRQQLRLWQDVTRRAAGEYAAAPAVLLAFLAYINGNGSLARIALDRCRQLAPSYTMAELIGYCLNLGIPPETVRDKIRDTHGSLPEVWGDSAEYV
ncbi:DUF4192 domain-containing protein [Sphaerisporangium sp. NPDC049003]|uniref:DUF4192 domain-containing protein n=1 Tax=Sphaerisporangium sp. NPDC049003 TaxID=3364517 RepID=UPI00370FC19A